MLRLLGVDGAGVGETGTTIVDALLKVMVLVLGSQPYRLFGSWLAPEATTGLELPVAPSAPLPDAPDVAGSV